MKPHRKAATSKNTSRFFLPSITNVDYNTVSLITFTLSNSDKSSKSQKAKGIPFAIYRLQRNSEDEKEKKKIVY